MIILLTAGAFLSGAILFSYGLGLAAKKNIRAVGDGNPGALNLWKAAGYRLGLLGIALDFLKGYLPVLWLAGTEYAEGTRLVPLALAPIAGHAFSPFLKGRGGKAIAVTFGVWSALTAFEASLAYAIVLALLAAAVRLGRRGRTVSAASDGLQVTGGMLLLGLYLLLRGFSPPLLGIWIGNLAIVVYKHRTELASWLGRKRRGAL